MLRTAICDDEPAARACLADLIRRQPQPCEVVEYGSAQECLADCRQTDLLFLDIELGPSSPDGMSLARELQARLPRPQPAVIFVTGHDRYVFDAFDVGAFQYLLKPVDEEKFAQVFARAAERLRAAREVPRALTLQVSGISRTILPEQLYYVESSNHKVILHLQDGEFSCYARLRDLEAELGESFCRIHKGYLVNLAYVDGYSKTSAVLSNGDTLLISKYKYQDFVKAYLRFLRKGAGL